MASGASGKIISRLKRLGRAAKCFFIDQGDHIDIPERDMRVLLEEFSFLPAQAKPVQLAGLKGFVDNPSAKRELTNLILRKRFIAKVFRRSTDSISVILFNENETEKTEDTFWDF